MRTSVICIQTRCKRKLDNVEFSNAEQIDSNNKDNPNKRIKSVGMNTSPNVNNIDEKSIKITHDFIKAICDTIKKSAKRVLGFKIFDKNIHNGEPSDKENELHNVCSVTNKEEGELSIENIKLKYNRPNYSVMASFPLNENLCLQNSKSGEIISPKMSLANLQVYLDKKKHMLRRSKTTVLPTHVICSTTDIQKFVWLIEEDPMISLFLKRDMCRRYADKYLLAMVLIYFARAHFTSCDFSRENFFAALYLAHDMEEDHEEIKYEVFPYCLGTKWRKYYTYLLSIRDDLFWALDCRAVVSKKCCEQVMSLIPNHWIWERERPEYHAFSNRFDPLKDEFCQPRGPFKSPLWCRACLERECLDSENSYIVYTSLSDTSLISEESTDLDQSRTVNKDSGFESFLLPHEEKNDEAFDTTLESEEVLSPSPPRKSYL